jgi:hypothetical protein
VQSGFDGKNLRREDEERAKRKRIGVPKEIQ